MSWTSDGPAMWSNFNGPWQVTGAGATPWVMTSASGWQLAYQIYTEQTYNPIDGPSWRLVGHNSTKYRTVPAGILLRNWSLTAMRGLKIRSTWTNDTGGYQIHFQLQCVEDPSYDFSPYVLPAGTTSHDDVFSDNSAYTLGYTFRAIGYYLPDGDVSWSGAIAAPRL